MKQESIFLEFGLSRVDAAAVGERFKLCHYDPYDTVFTQGDESDSFYYIGSGELTVLYEDAMGNQVVQNVLGPGQFIGEIGLLQDIPRSATIKALTNAQLYRLDKADFHDLLDHNASFADFLHKISIERQLAWIPAFRDLEHSDLAKIRQITREVEVAAGETVCSQGDGAEQLYLITNGQCALSQIEDGQPVSAGERGNGDYYDDQAFFARQPYVHTLTASTPTRMLVLDMLAFQALVNKDVSLAASLPGDIAVAKGQSFLQRLLPFLHDKSAYQAIPALSMSRPKPMLYSMLSVTFVLMVLAAVPSIWPEQFPYLNHLKVDTDPENMLPADEPARIFHDESRHAMDLYDMMVVGVVNQSHPDGIYNVDSLTRVHALTEYAKILQWQDDESGQRTGVVVSEMMALSTVDNIEQAGPGSISFSWLMRAPPTTRDKAIALRDKIKNLPMLNGTLASQDNQAIAIYLPLTSKDVSFRVYTQLREFLEQYKGSNDRFYVAGLPVAEDAFGVEMFIQMAISAPLAMLAIFIMMYLFFRNLTLIIAPMVIAMVAVICTMSLLIVSGQTIHIMSSMIAIFVMPIAVLDSVHILSEFFDFYPRIKDRRLTMAHVMRELFVPMFYTSVTTALGFASLALVPIPPVQVFGIFVAIGVILAWLLSISFIPAYIMLVKREKIDALIADREQQDTESPTMGRWLNRLRELALKHARPIVLASSVISALFIYGIYVIQVNDNPVRWFQEEHYLSVSDREMNRHFAGTYLAYVSLEVDDARNLQQVNDHWSLHLENLEQRVTLTSEHERLLSVPITTENRAHWFDDIEEQLEILLDSATDSDEEQLETVLGQLDTLREAQQTFKQPEVLNYIDRMQTALQDTGIVGKSLSLADLVKTINRELHAGDEKDFRIPDTARGVAQTLLTYQSSHRPQDIWHYITHDYRRGVITLMLNSGDNIDMNTVVQAAETFMQENPPPQALRLKWFGLNYINVIWQEKMVSGMLLSIIGSYLAVLLIMTFLLRSYLWGLLAMAPLTMTLLVIYGVLGLSGKYYDMPVAVLSALAIGLAVDFAVHFLVRIRHYHSQCNDWRRAVHHFFGEPAQAFVRNILVITLGFTPLLLASLVPYNTVGILIAAIMLVAGAVSLVLFTALFVVGYRYLFKRQDIRRTSLLDCRSVVFAGIVFYVLVFVSLEGVLPFNTGLVGLHAAIIILTALAVMKKCKALKAEQFVSREVKNSV